MPNEWVVLELSPKADGEDPDLVRASIRHIVRNAEVYLPVSVTKVGEDRIVNYLVDGYGFIKREQPDSVYYKLEGSRYVQSVITKVSQIVGRATRALACATDADIEQFKAQIRVEEDQGIGVGDTVVVMSGPYRQIRAVVIEDIPEKDTVQVHVKLRSKESIVSLPRSFLRVVERAPHREFKMKAVALRAWLTKLGAVAEFDADSIGPLRTKFQNYTRLGSWIERGRALEDSLRAGNLTPLDSSRLDLAWANFDRLQNWHRWGTSLVETIRNVEKTLDANTMKVRLAGFEHLHRLEGRWRNLAPLFLTPRVKVLDLDATYRRWASLVDITDRFAVLLRDVEQIELFLRERGLVDNVVIDGHNLAIRCATVPGLDSLKDSKGRPTGAIYGFFQSLMALRKKFHGAAITVVWDGSSQRRRKRFPAYKANRGELRATFEIDFLKQALPLFGVHQAWHPEEEADDVIATLLRGQYKGQRNVVVTTDRDLLQVVTPTDHVFVPAVGVGKEKVYTPELVERDYGVPAARMVHFRAIDGDQSDNIPGAPGFGPKMATKLLNLYGTVDGIFASNLAGLTPAQYTKLRGAEKQVRLNVELMTLLTDVPVTLVPPSPNADAAKARLLDVDVKAESILTGFFSSAGV